MPAVKVSKFVELINVHHHRVCVCVFYGEFVLKVRKKWFYTNSNDNNMKWKIK